MDLFVIDKMIIGFFYALTYEKIFIYLLGAMVGTFLYTGSKQKKKVQK